MRSIVRVDTFSRAAISATVKPRFLARWTRLRRVSSIV
jgi:hypothetical protein